MAAKARALGVALRPHVKTHKCPEIGRLQLARGRARHHGRDARGGRGVRGRGLRRRHLGLSPGPGAPGRGRRPRAPDHLPRHGGVGGGARGARRGGAPRRRRGARLARGGLGAPPLRGGPRGAGRASTWRAAWRRSRGVVFDGLLTHAGHSYHARSREERAAVAERERAAMVAFAGRLERAGVRVPRRQRGLHAGDVRRPRASRASPRCARAITPSTTSCSSPPASARAEDCAVTVLTSVVSHQAGADHVVVDAGALALSKDPGPDDPALRRGFGPVLRGPGGARAGAGAWRCGGCRRSTGWWGASARRTSRASPSATGSGSSPTTRASPSRCSTSTRWSAARRSWTAGRSAAPASRADPGAAAPAR